LSAPVLAQEGRLKKERIVSVIVSKFRIIRKGCIDKRSAQYKVSRAELSGADPPRSVPASKGCPHVRLAPLVDCDSLDSTVNNQRELFHKCAFHIPARRVRTTGTFNIVWDHCLLSTKVYTVVGLSRAAATLGDVGGAD